MREIDVLVVDDAASVAAAVATWLEEGGGNPLPPAEPVRATVVAMSATEELAEDLSDGVRYDVALVDLVIDKGYGGLGVLDLLARRSPATRVVVYSILDEGGDRLFYALAALRWFPQVAGFLPKGRPFTSNYLPVQSREFAGVICAVLDGTYTDQLSGYLRTDAVALFTRALANAEDLRRWQAVARYAEKNVAAEHLHLGRNTLGDWVNHKLDLVDQIWDIAAETEFEVTPEFYDRQGMKAPYAKLHQFASSQTYFWDDRFLASRL